jgi:hypothetical protein
MSFTVARFGMAVPALPDFADRAALLGRGLSI